MPYDVRIAYGNIDSGPQLARETAAVVLAAKSAGYKQAPESTTALSCDAQCLVNQTHGGLKITVPLLPPPIVCQIRALPVSQFPIVTTALPTSPDLE